MNGEFYYFRVDAWANLEIKGFYVLAVSEADALMQAADRERFWGKFHLELSPEQVKASLPVQLLLF